jgi:tRNA dimethylallyltransferase
MPRPVDATGGQPEFICLAGPTAVGKSDLAIALAERCGGEIVGADAFQVYRGFPLLSAQPSAADIARIPHHLVGCIDPAEAFDVAQWLRMARDAISGIRARRRLPVVCGGAGLYFRALLRGLAALPSADPQLRAELEGLAPELLFERYAALDPAGAERIDRANPRRLVRALEVCLLTGRPYSSFLGQWESAAPARAVVLLRGRDDLRERIAGRASALLAGGVLDEVRQLGPLGPTAELVLGLAEVRACLAGRITPGEAAEAIRSATWAYARRQLTWFRREPTFLPLELAADQTPEQALPALMGRLGLGV